METLHVTIGWRELARRTIADAIADDVLGLAAQLAYYLFLALFPALLFALALGSFFPLVDVADDVVRWLAPVASPAIVTIVAEQIARISESDDGGLLTFGVLGALWSSSAAMVAVTSALNAAYDIEETRPWWKVRLTAIALTVALSVFVVVSFALVLAGPSIAEAIGGVLDAGHVTVWVWHVLRWPVALALVSTGLGLVYYFAPDAEQDWVWISPGAVVGTVLWLGASLGFKFYVERVSDYEATYGAIGGVIVLLLWLYVSSLAILAGAELNAEIERASPHCTDPEYRRPGVRAAIGARAARAWRARQQERALAGSPPERAPIAPVVASYATPVRLQSAVDPSVRSSVGASGWLFGLVLVVHWWSRRRRPKRLDGTRGASEPRRPVRAPGNTEGEFDEFA